MSSDHEPDLLGPTRELLSTALRLGKRATDSGDSSGCYELCSCAVRLARKIKGLSEIADFRLESCLDRAGMESEPQLQARVICEAIDDLLDPDDVQDEPLSENPLEAIKSLIESAISIGAPAYNTGDQQGCYEVYACTARMILAAMNPPDTVMQKLREALNACEHLDEPNEQAWTMRHAFDAIGELGGVSPSLSPQDVQLYLALAIRIGAPAYNVGDHRGCYEVYACAARFLVNATSVTDEVRSILRGALEKASTHQNVSRQAWVLRAAFDSLLPAAESSPDSPQSES